MSNQHGSPAPTAAFGRFTKMILILQKRGLTQKEIDAFIAEKVLSDLGKEKAKRLEPSLN